MEEETHSCAEEGGHLCVHRKLDAASTADLEILVRGIDRSQITYLVRNVPTLQQHVFRGFRPDHLPWASVPSRLARHVGNDKMLRGLLLNLWVCSNAELQARVEGEVRADAFEPDVTVLLARIGIERRDRLWWALYLDERDDIHQLFIGGSVSASLLVESSPLVQEAKRLAHELEEAGGDANAGGEDLGAGEEMSTNPVDESNFMTSGDGAYDNTMTQKDAAAGAPPAEGVEDAVAGVQRRHDDSLHRECKERIAETLRLLDEVRLENAGLKMRLKRLEEDGMTAGDG